jgi:hypothetical protein
MGLWWGKGHSGHWGPAAPKGLDLRVGLRLREGLSGPGQQAGFLSVSPFAEEVRDWNELGMTLKLFRHWQEDMPWCENLLQSSLDLGQRGPCQDSCIPLSWYRTPYASCERNLGWLVNFVCVCVCCTRVWTQGFVLVSQGLFCLNHASSPFYCGYFGDRV